MKERPILCSGHEVRAILDGRKTQTRRIVKPQPSEHVTGGTYNWNGPLPFMNMPIDCILDACPYGQPGDRLWVKESGWIAKSKTAFIHTVGNENIAAPTSPGGTPYRRCPAVHMPRWVSRITLEITAIRVERLQDITEEDAIAEGIERQAGGFVDYTVKSRSYNQPTAKASYSTLWDSTNAKSTAAAIRGDAHPWESNPWVWVIEFKRL